MNSQFVFLDFQYLIHDMAVSLLSAGVLPLPPAPYLALIHIGLPNSAKALAMSCSLFSWIVLATGTFFFFHILADSSLSWHVFTAFFEGRKTFASIFSRFSETTSTSTSGWACRKSIFSLRMISFNLSM